MQADTHTNEEFMLDVGDGHTLYVQDWGNKNAATPFVVLHGGPGSQCKPKHKASFDPSVNRVIFFDQRGCGKSLPYGSLKNNTTEKLIADITTIIDKLGIKKVALYGTSWGSTLALAYAISEPTRVSAIVTGGVYTSSQAESNWVDKGDFKMFYPDVWQAYLDRTLTEHQLNPSAYHFDKVVNGTPDEQKLSGYAYDCLESGIIQLDDRATVDDFETYDPASIRIEMYYLANNCFMPERYILDNADKLTMPVYIVQGRYDMVCPPATAYELHQKLPNSKLYWVLSGHKIDHEGENVFRSIISNLA